MKCSPCDNWYECPAYLKMVQKNRLFKKEMKDRQEETEDET